MWTSSWRLRVGKTCSWRAIMMTADLARVLRPSSSSFPFFRTFLFSLMAFSLLSFFFLPFLALLLRTNSALRNHVTGSRQREREAPTRRPPVLDSVRMPMWKRPGLMPRLAAVFLDEIFSRDSYSSSSETTKRKTKLFFFSISPFAQIFTPSRKHGIASLEQTSKR